MRSIIGWSDPRPVGSYQARAAGPLAASSDCLEPLWVGLVGEGRSGVGEGQPGRLLGSTTGQSDGHHFPTTQLNVCRSIFPSSAGRARGGEECGFLRGGTKTSRECHNQSDPATQMNNTTLGFDAPSLAY